MEEDKVQLRFIVIITSHQDEDDLYFSWIIVIMKTMGDSNQTRVSTLKINCVHEGASHKFLYFFLLNKLLCKLTRKEYPGKII